MELGGVDRSFEFGGAYSRLVGEVPQGGAAILRCGEEVAATARPAFAVSVSVKKDEVGCEFVT